MKTVLAVIAFAAIALAIGIMLPSERKGSSADIFPWQVQPTARGSTRVFGLEIGHSTIGDAEKRFADEAEFTLFATDEGQFSAEAYFDRIDLAGLAARVVLNAGLPKERLEAMFQRGLRVASMGGGRRKVSLHPDDVEQVRNAPIATLTYLPGANLDEKAISGRFGEPSRRISEPDSEVVHWLYPKLGLDISIHPKEKEVFQYVPPAEFDRLMKPLEEKTRPKS